MTYALAERDGALYAKETIIDPWEPRMIINWYRLGTTLMEFATWFASEDLMRKRIGSVLSPTIHPATVWRDEQGWIYRIASGISGERKPAITEITPISEPAQHGRKYPLQWHKGAWHKETKKGLVKLAS